MRGPAEDDGSTSEPQFVIEWTPSNLDGSTKDDEHEEETVKESEIVKAHERYERWRQREQQEPKEQPADNSGVVDMEVEQEAAAEAESKQAAEDTKHKGPAAKDKKDDEEDQDEEKQAVQVVWPDDVRSFKDAELSGWGFRSKRRCAGATSGLVDVYLFPPGEGKALNSMVACKNFIGQNNLQVDDETVAKMWAAAKGACDQPSVVPPVLR